VANAPVAGFYANRYLVGSCIAQVANTQMIFLNYEKCEGVMFSPVEGATGYTIN